MDIDTLAFIGRCAVGVAIITTVIIELVRNFKKKKRSS
jgi:hypothetical protein